MHACQSSNITRLYFNLFSLCKNQGDFTKDVIISYEDVEHEIWSSLTGAPGKECCLEDLFVTIV